MRILKRYIRLWKRFHAMSKQPDQISRSINCNYAFTKSFLYKIGPWCHVAATGPNLQFMAVVKKVKAAVVKFFHDSEVGSMKGPSTQRSTKRIFMKVDQKTKTQVYYTQTSEKNCDLQSKKWGGGQLGQAREEQKILHIGKQQLNVEKNSICILNAAANVHGKTIKVPKKVFKLRGLHRRE